MNHFYADDIQLYVAIKNAWSIEAMEKGIYDYKDWMIADDVKSSGEILRLFLLDLRITFCKFLVYLYVVVIKL